MDSVPTPTDPVNEDHFVDLAPSPLFPPRARWYWRPIDWLVGKVADLLGGLEEE